MNPAAPETRIFTRRDLELDFAPTAMELFAKCFLDLILTGCLDDAMAKEGRNDPSSLLGGEKAFAPRNESRERE